MVPLWYHYCMAPNAITHHGGQIMSLDENDPRFIEIDKRLHAIVKEMDDDFLERVTNTEWEIDSQDSHWFTSVMQMMYCIVASHDVRIDDFFVDWGVEPHNIYLLPEYERRKELGIYPAKKFDGMNKDFDRGANFGMHGITKK